MKRNKKNRVNPPTPCKSAVVLLILFIAAVPVFSQTAEEIDHLLTLDTVNYGQAAWLILNAAGVPDMTEPSLAFIYAKEKNWLPGNASIDNNARLDGVSLLIMNAWNLKGGIMYSITKSARYAYRELVYINVIQGRFSPRMAVAPDQLLYMINFILAREENNE
ncbi:MAG: hypothetical protein FWD22_03835 [Treponema sp.]|nr:hypothetical protein [Treponema sp.]